MRSVEDQCEVEERKEREEEEEGKLEKACL